VFYERRSQRSGHYKSQPAQARAGHFPSAIWTRRLSLLAVILLSAVPLVLYMPLTTAQLQLESMRPAIERIRAQFAGVLHGPSRAAAPVVASVVAPPVPASPSVPATAGQPIDHSALHYGDRLKITFFESVGVAVGGPGGGNDGIVTTVFPRMDISAVYPVEENGTLAIPKLGRFAVAGQPITSLQATLTASFRQAMGRAADVQVAIEERQPVYVLGAVRGAGVFKHVPGMTVLQALASAGGIPSATSDMSRAIEEIRESQRLRQAGARLGHLLIDQARLLAARDEAADLVLPANAVSRLASLVSPEMMRVLMDGAQATLKVERAGFQQQRALAERQVDVARAEVDAQTKRAAQLDVLIHRKSQLRRELESIASHGSVSQFKLVDADAEIAELGSRREDLRVAITQSARRLVEAEIALAKLKLERSTGIERELSAVRQSVSDSEQEIAAMREVVHALAADEASPGTSLRGPLAFEITRRGAGTIITIPANETTALLPGDVVRVTFVGSPEQRDGRPAPDSSFVQHRKDEGHGL
jgi:polysaccharide biosynthesis/export protein ExoF